MAGRIKGITVEINDDTTKLSKALQGVVNNYYNNDNNNYHHHNRRRKRKIK